MTADNPYTGESDLVLGGKLHTLVFDFRSLATIHAQCGANAIKGFFEDAMNADPMVLAKIVHAGLHRKHPEVTLDMVLDGLGSYIETTAVLTKGLLFAYFGTDKAQAKDEPAEESKKN